jgi:hypothetical protein
MPDENVALIAYSADGASRRTVVERLPALG